MDCQTTGMHPSTGYLLQMGWSIVDPSSLHVVTIEKWTLKLPNDEVVPNKIKKMLHLTEEELQHSVEPKILFDKFQYVLTELGSDPVVIAHYAQFEKSFLKQLYKEHAQTQELNFQLICSQKIAKRLLPHIPSHNLKAVAGHFKWPNTPKNEIHSHVSMTIHVWKQLLPRLLTANVSSYKGLIEWLTTTKCPNKKNAGYEYNIERLERLKLSSRPGVYRMLAEDRTILYIGKATSLKARVNSYFRGVKNRDRRKLEMLAQVWDIETIECETPLEAALLESDEIKKWTPPYNILLKSENRSLIFYNYDYSDFSENKNPVFLNGPYKPSDAVVTLMELFNALKTKVTIDYGDDCITPETLNNAWLIFCSMHHVENTAIEELDIRKLFLLGYTLLKQFETVHGKGAFQKWWVKEKKKKLEEDLVVEEKIACKMTRIFIRAAEAKRKSRMLSRLYNCTLMIQSTQKKLIVINGTIMDGASPKLQDMEEFSPFEPLHYDRLSILLSALNSKTVTFISP